ncbi:MAG: DUF4176 domain-containing protein [Streptococcaceae bacterium]|jgi:hypothetical protein|nr:DUF4176 domain-containing protein [Streptococcaceae bacterium]
MAEIKEEQLLPVGSVVYLKEGTLKVVILARGQLMAEKLGKQIYYDYLGGIYPQGFSMDNSYNFNNEQIERIVFKGYEDEEEERYRTVVKEWKMKHKEEYNIEKSGNSSLGIGDTNDN